MQVVGSVKSIVGKCLPLSREEELALFSKWRSTGDRNAQDLLVRSLIPFALKSAWDFSSKIGRRFDCEDFESAALLGLSEAIERFDPDRGTRLSTYAGYYIFMRLELERKASSVVRVPGYLQDKRENTKSVRSWDKNRESAIAACKAQESISGGESWLVADVLPPDEELSYLEERELLAKCVDEALKTLPDRDRFILERWADGANYQEISLEVEVTRQRVHQIQKRALGKLRGLLKGFVEC